MNALLQTGNQWSSLVLRVVLGVVMFPHGAQKVLGWFGGRGFAASTEAFTTQMHIPALLASLAIVAEFGGSLGLLVGLLTRVAAFGMCCVMVVAIWMVHGRYGWFMNWSGQHAGEGFEYHLLVIAICLALMISGAGKWSIDRKLTSS